MLIATGLGTGYFPVSGTVASVLAVLLYLPFAGLNTTQNGYIFLYGALLMFLLALAIWSSGLASVWLGEKDPHKVVIDEIAGYFFAMTLLPTNIPFVIAAFFLFRFFDVVKPPPIKQSQDLPGGVGVTIDDILAGIATCILLHLAHYFIMGTWSPALISA